MFHYLASSFADEDDLAAFQRCKEEGGSDHECFKVGDNGQGQWGAITAQSHTAMVALHADDLTARWGSVDAGAHRTLRVTYNNRSTLATVEDRCGIRGRIDLNPATCKLLGLRPPVMVPVTWEWVE